MAEVLVRPVLARESARSRLERASFGLAFGLAGTLAALLLVAPTVIVLVTSFTNAYSLRFPPPGYSTRWYEALWNDSPEILEAAQRSLEVAGQFATDVLGLERSDADEFAFRADDRRRCIMLVDEAAPLAVGIELTDERALDMTMS